MAIYHCSMKPIARSAGRSAVASAAYRAAEKLTNERDGLTHDFTRKAGVEHVEIMLPNGVNADWAKDRSKLWNAAERAENRKDARVAREFEVALPHELSHDQRIALARAFAEDLANRYGVAVDVAVHRPHPDSDIRNHHAHIMMTTRQVTHSGLGEKTAIERENKWLLSNHLPTSQMQLRDLRLILEEMTNRHLALAGLDIRVDHRSHSERGLEITPTEHAGVHATQMKRQGKAISRARLDEDAARRNAVLIRKQPEQVLTLITAEKSVFDRYDVARTLHRYINHDAQTFRNAFATVMASPSLVELQPETADGPNGLELARYSTREMVAIEQTMAGSAQRMARATSHSTHPDHVDRAINQHDEAIRKSVRTGLSDHLKRAEISTVEYTNRIAAAGLSGEQRAAIRHITGAGQIAAVVGYAGAGKSTMLAAARDAWQAQGLRVHGAALSGKAAEGLEESSSIPSRTLASWEMRWQNPRRVGREQLSRNDVFVIDEAGMVGSRQLARFVAKVEKAGAKLVLVGDHEQLQAIGAGAPLRSIAEQIGFAELSDIRRQRDDWQRAASVLFATHKTAEGLAAYEQNGDVQFHENSEYARAEIVRDYLADRKERPDGSRAAMAHRRADVRAINAGIRSALQERGELAKGEEEQGPLGRELIYQTNDGRRQFAPYDRIVFLENNRDLGVKNGMLGTVVAVEPEVLQVRLDGKGRGVGDVQDVIVSMTAYQAIDHGYATTIHKNQGATVDRSFVLASTTMDRHLTYVAMTRHRDAVTLYGCRDAFTDNRAGRLVAHGKAPYQHDANNHDSYYVTLEAIGGHRQTVWGVDLERAMTAASPKIGDTIGLEHAGSQTVRLPDGTTAERNRWTVLDADALARVKLIKRLSRDGLKETTLDYTRAFAERRGIAVCLGIRGEILREPSVRPQRNLSSRVVHPTRDGQGLSSLEQGGSHRQVRPHRGILDESDSVQTAAEKPAPLVPAIRNYARSVEEIAREKAMQTFEQYWNSVQTVAALVYADPDATTDIVRTAIIDKGADGRALGKAIADRPETFGQLRGKTGLLGDNKVRKEARAYARSVGSHVQSASVTWDRRLGEVRSSEQWQRDKRDTIEVPGLTRQSSEILSQVDQIPLAERNGWIDQLRQTPEGQKALGEAKTITDALRHRFGDSDPARFGPRLERDIGMTSQVETIRLVAKTVDRVRMAELTRDLTLKQELSRSKALGLGL